MPHYDYWAKTFMSRQKPSEFPSHSSQTDGEQHDGDSGERDPTLQDRSLAFTRFSIDRMADAAFWMGSDARLIYVNQAACQSLGYTREELLSMTVHEIDPDFPPEAWPAHWAQLKSERSMRFESHHRTKDGHVFPVEISANFIEFDGRQYNCAFGRNISDRKRAEAERQRLLEALEQKNRELQSILFIASHDLRSPLVNVQGFAGELERACATLKDWHSGSGDKSARNVQLRALLNEDIPEALGFIRSGIERIDALVAGLLRLARVGATALRPARIDMDDLIDSVLHTLQFQATQFQADIQVDPLPACYGDRALIEQVFANLVDNALKYRDPERDCCIHIAGQAAGPHVVYSVRDNGIGIDADNLDRVFDLFYRLQPDKHTGDGLGLTIIKRILDRVDGQIRVESESGQGTAFHVTLPVG